MPPSRSTDCTTSCSQLVPGKTTTPIRAATSERLELEVALLDDRVGQQPVSQFGHLGPRRALVGRLDLEAEGASGSHLGHPIEAESGQRALDGGAFRIGDPGPQLHLDAGPELHAEAPY